MRTIWKFSLPVGDVVHRMMPAGAKVLCVQTQGVFGPVVDGEEQPCLWALVDPNAPTELRSFAIYGTGHPIDETKLIAYVGTFQLSGGSLVFHTWEVTP